MTDLIDPVRRRLITAWAATAAAATFATPWKGDARAEAPVYRDDPFKLGVASGDPSPEGFVVWTRIAPNPFEEDGGMEGKIVPVMVEVAADEAFTRIIATRRGIARPDRGYAVHVEFSGLPAGRNYWYRFRSGGVVSPVGRAMTAPELGSRLDKFRFGWVSCSHYEQGYFTPYRDLAAQNPDLVLSTGDYIYEVSYGPQLRRQVASDAVTLTDYRLLHAQYKTDPDLQKLHAACPWLFIWDDHEVANDYQGDIGKMPPGLSLADFGKRKLAAYQAFYEHTPLRLRSRFDAANRMRIWGESGFGDLIDFTLLDGRQYRSRLACSPVDRQEATSAVIAKCEELKDPNRTMLGAEQERFVSSQYMQPPYVWSVLVQQTLFSELNQTNRAGEPVAYTDGWSGYAPARQRIIDVMSARAKTSNAVVVGGDMHAFWASDVKADFTNPNSPTVATEFVTTSVTSHSYAYDRFMKMLPDNPHIKFFDDRVRGYCLADVSRTAMKVQLRSVDSVWRRDIPFKTLKSYVVAAGRPGIQEA